MKCKQCAYAIFDYASKVYCTAMDDMPTAEQQARCTMQCYGQPDKPHRHDINTATLTERINADEGRKPNIVAFLH